MPNGGGSFVSAAGCILYVTPFAGSGWVRQFHGAIDNVRLHANGSELLNANFETALPPVAALPPVPCQGWHAQRRSGA